MVSGERIPLLYALHSGNLYGTERMALATAAGLSARFDPVIFAPPGPVLAEALRLGLAARPFAGAASFARAVLPYMGRGRRVAFVATGVLHSAVFYFLQRLSGVRSTHLHVVHGGTDERLSYGRKKHVLRLGGRIVAVSDFVRSRLALHGVPPERVTVIENFLAAGHSPRPTRGPFANGGVGKAVVVSRLDPIKRVGLLLDALEADAGLRDLEIRVLGDGWEAGDLARRAARSGLNVRFLGFVRDVPAELAASDLLIHTCPEEPFGLSILEAMEANVPVLVPDSGGAGSLVQDGESGFHFRASDTGSLAGALRSLRSAPRAVLNRVVLGGRRALDTRFSAAARIADYGRLLMEEYA